MASGITWAICKGHQPTRHEVETIGEESQQVELGFFAHIVETQQERITQLAYRLLGWREEEVEDVVQEVFLAAFINLGKFRRQSNIRTWLTKITINKCRSWRRKQLLKLKLLYASSTRESSAARGTTTPSVMMVENERYAQIRRAVQRLPRRLREVVVLRYLEELPIEEVAVVLEISSNAVYVRLSRAREHLKDKLAGMVKE